MTDNAALLDALSHLIAWLDNLIGSADTELLVKIANANPSPDWGLDQARAAMTREREEQMDYKPYLYFDERLYDQQMREQNPGYKTEGELQHLKADWLHDPIGDIEKTPGFEAYHDELLAYRQECERKWQEERERRPINRAKANAEKCRWDQSQSWALIAIAETLEKIYSLQCEVDDRRYHE